MPKHGAPVRIDLPAPDPAPWEPLPPARSGATCAVCGRLFKPAAHTRVVCPACRRKAARRRKGGAR
jgi:hypothetical protein